jgi:hypothetical protein
VLAPTAEPRRLFLPRLRRWDTALQDRREANRHLNQEALMPLVPV